MTEHHAHHAHTNGGSDPDVGWYWLWSPSEFF